jgi:hypothetical protein
VKSCAKAESAHVLFRDLPGTGDALLCENGESLGVLVPK